MIRRATIAAAAAMILGGCAHTPTAPAPPSPQPVKHVRIAPGGHDIIPVPATFEQIPGDTFTLDLNSIIVAQGGAEVQRIAGFLASLIGTTRETTPRVVTVADTTKSVIELALDASAPSAPESYDLSVTHERVRIAARTPAGLFYGVQTLRQLLPYNIEYTAALPVKFMIPAVHITDAPRYEWRGMMLDVARHFLPADDVKRFIDIMALYKLNRLHLHLADDQGWRVEIPSWPNLTAFGGTSQVGGLGGGYYTQQQFADLVQYARDRFITIIPEIDMPGHINAALASYPEMNCDSIAPPLYTGTGVGFSLICLNKDNSYKFIDDVVAAISALDPESNYFHIGGDEVHKAGRPAYNAFVERVQKIVAAHNKTMIGWSEIALANLPGDVVLQSWIPDSAHIAAARGSRVILSPASKLYYDMQYDPSAPLGLHWGGYVDLFTAYNWEPAEFNPKLPAAAILGLEAPIWAETLGKLADYEYMALPRMTALAELSWSQPSQRSWQRFIARIPQHELRWTAMGANYHRSNPDLTPSTR